MSTNTTKTGLVCPQCRQHVAAIEHEALTLTFRCPACGHRWSADAPGRVKH